MSQVPGVHILLIKTEISCITSSRAYSIDGHNIEIISSCAAAGLVFAMDDFS